MSTPTRELMQTVFRLSGGDPDVDRPPPLLGEHTEELLRELGYDAPAIAELRAASVI